MKNKVRSFQPENHYKLQEQSRLSPPGDPQNRFSVLKFRLYTQNSNSSLRNGRTFYYMETNADGQWNEWKCRGGRQRDKVDGNFFGLNFIGITEEKL